MNKPHEKAHNALYGVLVALSLLPGALAYIAVLVGLWRFIMWCIGGA